MIRQVTKAVSSGQRLIRQPPKIPQQQPRIRSITGASSSRYNCYRSPVRSLNGIPCDPNAANQVLRKDQRSVIFLVYRSYSASAINNEEYPAHTLYPMPALSPTMDAGTIASWNISEGDEFSAGTSLCTIETDKASVDFEAQDDGILAKILRQGPTAVDIRVGTPICVVVDSADDAAAFSDFVVEDSSAPSPVAPAEAPAAAAVAAASAAPAPAVTTATSGVASILLPSARHLAESKGLDATILLGSGKGGRVTKGDVIDAIASNSLPPLQHKATTATTVAVPTTVAAATALPVTAPVAAPAPIEYAVPEIVGNTYTDQPNNKMRKIIAARLTESKRDVPHFYTSMEVELDNIMKLRKQLASKHDVKISVNDFIIRCSALALRDVPEVNSTYNVKSDTVSKQETIDISVAVATPTGLITPIVFGTDKLGLFEITTKVKDLATRARDGKLAPHEFQGGSFTISNLGMFGIDEFSAVINPPQAAILAVGGGTKKLVAAPYVDSDTPISQVPPKVKSIMTARLSADRRVIDEATSAVFLQAFRHYINTPELLLL